MKTFLLTLIFCVSTTSILFAQQLPLFSQYRENQGVLNPAAVNLDFLRNNYNLSLGASYHKQWDQADLQLDNGNSVAFGPLTTTIRAEWIIPEKRFFVGGYFMNDEAGAFNLNGAYFRAGYFIIDPAQSSFALAGAISAGYNSFKLDFDYPGIFDYNTQYSDVGSTDSFSQNFMDFGVGLFGWVQGDGGGGGFSQAFKGDIIYFGASVPQIRGLPLSEPGSLNSDLSETGPENYLQLNVLSGIYKYIGAESFVEGSLMFTKLMKSSTPFKITFNGRFHYKDWLWVGAGVNLPFSKVKGKDFAVIASNAGVGRSGSDYNESILLFDVGFNVGQNINSALEGKNFKIGIGYEIPLGGLLAQLGNTIEINFTYTMSTAGGRR